MDSADVPTLEPINRPSLTEATTEILRERILQGAFAPGERLVEVEISRQLGVSRAPVREALAVLRSEGLAYDDPRRGSYVTTLGSRDIEEIYEVRAALETGAAYLIIERNDPGVFEVLSRALDRMQEAATAGDRAAFIHADLGLHAVICRESGNERLARIADTQRGLLHTLIRLEMERVVETFEPLMQEHANLVEEIRTGDRVRAAAAVWSLFRRTSAVLIGDAPEREQGGDPDTDRSERRTSRHQQ